MTRQQPAEHELAEVRVASWRAPGWTESVETSDPAHVLYVLSGQPAVVGLDGCPVEVSASLTDEVTSAPDGRILVVRQQPVVMVGNERFTLRQARSLVDSIMYVHDAAQPGPLADPDGHPSPGHTDQDRGGAS